MLISGKILYREGRDAKQNRKVVERYKRMTSRIKGAVLCCVFRGRNSEGSNFPDDEARGILLVGVPYANYSDPIVKAQIRYFNKIKQGLGQRWYIMDAFKVANQSLGRGIRGRDDWCHYWLLDRRYAEQERVTEFLKKIPDSIDSKNLFEYDLIIVMEKEHEKIILEKNQKVADKIVVWNIRDPYQLPYKQACQVFDKIKSKVGKLGKTLYPK